MKRRDLVQLWEEHTKHEFATRDTEATLATMVDDAYVDEMIFSFTHSQEMAWMLPGIAPTNRRVEVPLVAIVQFRGDKLAHDIYWDQASVLKQIGLLGNANLPVFGAETARKVSNPKVQS